MPDTILVIPDATEADGTPYEAAEAAVDAALEALAAAQKALNVASVLARNAELSRQIEFNLEPSVAEWERTLPFKRLHDAADRVALSRNTLAPVKQAVRFDPKEHTP